MMVADEVAFAPEAASALPAMMDVGVPVQSEVAPVYTLKVIVPPGGLLPRKPESVAVSVTEVPMDAVALLRSVVRVGVTQFVMCTGIGAMKSFSASVKTADDRLFR